jgi:hypothetical protein
VSTATTSRRSDAGFWSSAASFFLPLGSQIDPTGVRGYQIDMRVKAASAHWPQPDLLAPGRELHVGTAQYGLGCYERWLAGDGEQWLEAALAAGRHLVSIQRADGSWLHDFAFPHTFPLPPPWASGIAQGEGASLLVRLHLETREPDLAAAAKRAIAPLLTPMRDGGVRGELGGRPWPEEYPTSPESHVLNGAVFALWGMRDVAVGLGDESAGREFQSGVDALAANLARYDAGFWSLYSLYPHPVRNVASSFYHALHVSQLEAMEHLAPRPEFAEMRTRWDGYASSAACRARAFAHKAAFRLLVPRNRWFAHRMPWTRA